MTETAPKPCPFCGRKPEVEECDDGSVWVSCSDSSMNCPAYGNGAELAVWNRRPQQSAEPVAYCLLTKSGAFHNVGLKLWLVKAHAQEIADQHQDAIVTPLFAASPGPSELVERPNPETQVVAEIMQRDGRFSFHSLVPIEQFHDGMKLYRSPVESAPALAPFEKPKKEPETFEPSNEGSFLDLGGYF